MAALLARLRFFIASAVNGLWRTAGITSLAVLTIALALALLGSFAVGLSNLERVAEELGREVEMSAYLAPAVSSTVAEAHVSTIAGWPKVAGARYVTAAAALEWLEANLGPDADVLEGLPAGVLPASIEVRLDRSAWTASEVAPIAAKIGALEGVDDVRYGQEDIERVNALLSFSEVAALVVGIALCLAAILIVSNTIRLTVYARREEIEVMSLIGATNAFVRAPFVIEGILQGMLGGVLAGGLLIALREALTSGLQFGLSYAYGPVQLEFAPGVTMAGLIVVGALLGLVGGSLAVGRWVQV